MRILYSLLLYSLIPLAVTRLLWRSFRSRGYRHGHFPTWRQR